MLRCLAILVLLCGPAPSLAEPFFPPGTWYTGEGSWTLEQSDAFFEDWYGGQLRAMDEAPLWPDAGAGTGRPTLRLLFLPSFHHGAMVRIHQDDDGSMRFVFKRLSGAGGYEPGDIDISDGGVVGERDIRQIRDLFDHIMPFSDDTPTSMPSGCFDGTVVILEVVEAVRYRALDRHQCNLPAGDPIRDLVDLMNEVSGNRMITPGTFKVYPRSSATDRP